MCEFSTLVGICIFCWAYSRGRKENAKRPPEQQVDPLPIQLLRYVLKTFDSRKHKP